MKLSEVIAQHLHNDGMRFRKQSVAVSDGWDAVYWLGHSSRNCCMWSRILVDNTRRVLRILVSNGLKVGPEAMGPTTEFLAKLNFGCQVGAMVIDPEDGEIMFAASIFIDDADPSPEFFRGIVVATASAYDCAIPGLVRVLYTGATADEALAAMGIATPALRDEVVAKLLGDRGCGGDTEIVQPPFPLESADDAVDAPRARRGRPRKNRVEEQATAPRKNGRGRKSGDNGLPAPTLDTPAEELVIAKRRPGRPRKNPEGS